MDAEPSIAGIGALLGSPARTAMLSALMDGRALTATELAYHARITPQTASSHLAKLTDARLLVVARQGRHRYYSLASPRIAEVLEPLTTIVAHAPVPHRKPSKELLRLRDARLCYDHLAGRLGVALADALQDSGCLAQADRDFTLTRAGEKLFDQLAIDLEAVRRQRRLFARACIDWSERRPHLGGALGAALAGRLLELKWIRREPRGRRVTMTESGAAELQKLMPRLRLDDDADHDHRTPVNAPGQQQAAHRQSAAP
jgi:DNA-binding transcriptional ArsR family regulator